ncbi:acyl-CoA synthetase [Pseudaminobacter manganicus]|uniref:Acyl-CoA synthetase n=1 Tax=Manganibacter manganicus TaxID=1873176 RepID=A0A1V8RMR1_9HYPH|nr:acyl-CoA synthetase [Pseudaminobacter manganicus]
MEPLFPTLPQALDSAASLDIGFNFYSGKGVLVETLTFRDLKADALQLSRKFLSLGLKPGDRLALVAETEADFVRSFFGCQYAGLVPVPLPLPMVFGGRDVYFDHIRRMAECADVRVALAPASLRDLLVEAMQPFDLAFVGALADLSQDPAPAIELPVVAPKDLCYLQFSSGSTRAPMGVAVTQHALMTNASAMVRNGLEVGPEDRFMSWLPFYHDMGLVGFMLTPLVAGIQGDYLATRDFARRPLLWLDLISRNGATVSYSPTFGYDLCTRRAATATMAGLDLSRWRAAGIGGDMIRPDVMAAFADRFCAVGFARTSFLASYGMAEVSLALSFAPLGSGIVTQSIDQAWLERTGAAVSPRSGANARSFVLCGRALPGHEIEVRDVSGVRLGEQRVGRIFARGPSLMQGYYRDPEATSAALSPDGWLDTGDLGYLTQGQIVITGRAKDLLIINGRNIWPQDLEWTAESEVEGLRSGDVAVFSVDEDGGEERVIALVECRLPDAESRAAMSAAIAASLRSRHGVAVEPVLVKPHTLPVTSSGKLSRIRAREFYRRMRGEGELSASA